MFLRKGVDPYEYRDDWEKFNETSLPEKEDFYNHLNMKGSTDVAYTHAKTAFKELNINDESEYHNLYVESDTLLLADIFNSFRNICFQIFRLNIFYSFFLHQHYLWRLALKKSRAKGGLLTDINKLLMVDKGISGGIFRVIEQYAKTNNKKYLTIS